MGGTAVLRIVRVFKRVEFVLGGTSCANPARGTAFRLSATFAGDKVTVAAADRSLIALGLSLRTGGVGFMVDSGGSSHTVANFVATP